MNSSTKLIAALIVSMLAVAAIACSSDPSPFSTTTPESEEPAAIATSAPEPTASTASSAGAAAGGDAAAGEQAFTANGCNACHSTGSNTVIGPGLAGVGSRGDAAYVLESITNPGAVVVDGFVDLMPPNFSELPAADLDNLVAYLLTLN